MKVILIEKHDGEGVFPAFPKGSTVENLAPCEESKHWMSCTIDGRDIYIPDFFVDNNRLNREYNPTELVADKDEIFEVEEIVFEWLYGKNGKGVYGWIPAEKVVSLSLK